MSDAAAPRREQDSYVAAEVTIFTETQEDMNRCLDAVVRENGAGACITIRTVDVPADEAPAGVRSFFAIVGAAR